MSGIPREDVLQAIDSLCSGLGIDATEQAMAEHFVAVAQRLAPDVRVAVRTVQTGTLKRVALATTGQPTRDEMETLHLPQDMVAGISGPRSRRLRASPGYVPVFDGTSSGRVFPMIQDGHLMGAVNLEGEDELPDELSREIATLVAILARAVRDRRLSRDARFLRRWLATTVDNANALIFVVDSTFRVTLCNRALCEVLGITQQDVLDRDVLEWVVASQRASLRGHLAAALDGRSATGIELTLKGRDGEPLPTIFNIARPADVVEAVVAIGQDVTTVKLLENQVIQAEKMASLGQLAAGVVHEINNPLTSVTVYAEYLVKKFQNQGCEAADVAMLEKILEGSNRILKFTRDLVDYGKPTASQVDVMSLNEVVQQSVSFCEHVLEHSGADLTLELASDLPPLYGVKDQLQQVIINLLTNACHAVSAAGGQLRVTTRDQGGRMVAVEISDNGCGIPVQDLPQIFEPFFTTKAPGEGTGLGLSIVKKIVDFHNGRIIVESEEGKGATFCITLPTGHS